MYGRVLGFVCRHGAAAHAAVVEAAHLDALRRAVVGGGLLVEGLHGARQPFHLRAPRLVRPGEPCASTFEGIKISPFYLPLVIRKVARIFLTGGNERIARHTQKI